MTAVILLAGLALLALPGLEHGRLERLSPLQWCRATAMTLRAGMAVLQLGLFLGAAPTVLRLTGIEKAADACHRLFGPVAPGGAATGVLSAATLVYVVRGRRRARRHVRRTAEVAAIEPWIGAHQIEGGVDHVTIPGERPLAYAVPGPTPQIVVTDQLRASLTPDELAGVLRHETSHLQRGHHRQLTLACEVETVFARLPAVLRSTALLRLAVERVADEDAITTAEHRGHIRAALVKTATFLTSAAVPAFTPAATILHRIAALDAPQATTPSTRTSALLPIGMAVAGAWTAVIVGSVASHHLLVFITFCLS